MPEPEWTRVKPSMKQKSIIDYIITDSQTLAESGNVSIDYTDTGCSDHFLVWMELGRIVKNKMKVKCVIRKWQLHRFENNELKLIYQNALKDEVHRFSESISSKVKCGMEGYNLVH